MDSSFQVLTISSAVNSQIEGREIRNIRSLRVEMHDTLLVLLHRLHDEYGGAFLFELLERVAHATFNTAAARVTDDQHIAFALQSLEAGKIEPRTKRSCRVFLQVCPNVLLIARVPLLEHCQVVARELGLLTLKRDTTQMTDKCVRRNQIFPAGLLSPQTEVILLSVPAAECNVVEAADFLDQLVA